jgi:hypothetical protein
VEAKKVHLDGKKLRCGSFFTVKRGMEDGGWKEKRGARVGNANKARE